MAQAAAVDVPEPKVGSLLPEPKGYQLLIALPDVERETEGGIIKPDITVETERVAAVTGFVQAMGPDAYGDEAKFPGGPYCKVGDFIMMQAFCGVRFKIKTENGEAEFRLINDDQVKATVEDPRGITRA